MRYVVVILRCAVGTKWCFTLCCRLALLRSTVNCSGIVSWSVISTRSDVGSHLHLLLNNAVNEEAGRAADLTSKGCEFKSRQKRRENVPFQSDPCVLTFVRCSFLPRITAEARKRSWPFCQKCTKVTPKHAYTLGPTKSEWADYAAVQA